ncbi:MAG: hypothetical protein ABH881_00080 [bacterium]
MSKNPEYSIIEDIIKNIKSTINNMRNRTNKSIQLIICLIFCFGVVSLTAKAAGEFDPNYILNDDEMVDSDSMTLTEIDEFLRSKGGYIATASFPDAEGKVMKAAEIIYNAAKNNYDCSGATNLSAIPTISEKISKCEKISINPKMLLVLLQKEQSLIEDPSPTQSQMDWALGYGCPDGQACNTRWKGFGKQVNSAALQFFDYMQNPRYYKYQAGGTYTVSNTNKPDMIISPVNQATAALYNYTPHVYNGNYNFYNLWLKYFTHGYPNGSLLQAKGEVGVWLIQDGKKRPFLTKGALTSRFDINRIIQVNKSDLDKYPKGDPIKFPQYSILRSPIGDIFLIDGDKRRKFADAETFRLIGYNPEEIIDVNWPDITMYAEGKEITVDSEYITGALLQDKTTGGVYYVFDGTKAPLWSAIFLKTKFKYRPITQVDPSVLQKYVTIEPVVFDDGELLKDASSPGVYVIENKIKRLIPSARIFEELGYKWGNIITAPSKILDLYLNGDPVSSAFIADTPAATTATTSTEL